MTRKVCIQEAKDIFHNTLNHKRHIHHKATLKHLINQCWKAIGNTSQGKYVAICIYTEVRHITHFYLFILGKNICN